jgi:hypothetical protein
VRELFGAVMGVFAVAKAWEFVRGLFERVTR